MIFSASAPNLDHTMTVVHAPSLLGPSTDLTPALGTVYSSDTQLSQLLESDDALKTVARLTSERGVLFFRKQDMTLPQQKILIEKLGAMTNRPADAGLHRGPMSEHRVAELGAETSVIASYGGIARAGVVPGTLASTGWHSDISFEKVGSDYAMLKVHTLPRTGGDTLWGSMYEAYDRLSPRWKKLVEGTTCVHDGNFFHETAKLEGRTILSPRGHPDNAGEDLSAVHPVVRTHPLTGRRFLFVNPVYSKRILELTPPESDATLAYLFKHIVENHDLQLRYCWEKDDIAVWDNRCTVHCATNDYGNALREGYRVVGVGEKSFFDPDYEPKK
ncbi:taurine catabolism dioxygenase [Exidia glandulosa HHB12029]|uniref:Taurine catabolism dioxygenase n=1 Tax=Exidia glandulosa HHB12029 TaxID=1314781 RepID=A0A165M078_EXIGL|nr:taurine catabolism dioxygenase [Exidia glandulosa HHB12029]